MVIGKTGSLKWDGVKQYVSIRNQSVNSWTNLPTRIHFTNDSYLAKRKAFIEYLDSKKSPMDSGRNGLKT